MVEDIVNSKLADHVPNLVVMLLLVGIMCWFMWKLVNKMTSSNETLQQKHLDATYKLTTESHAFHSELTEKSNKVIIDSTVQAAKTQMVLDKVLERLK